MAVRHDMCGGPRGFWHSHFGWLLHHERTNPARFAPDLLAGRDVVAVNPTCARHGVDRGQIDMSAAVIAVFERLGWAHDVRWPAPRRLARLAAARARGGLPA